MAAGVHDVAAGVHDVAAGVHDVAAGVHDVAAGVHDVAAGVHDVLTGAPSKSKWTPPSKHYAQEHGLLHPVLWYTASRKCDCVSLTWGKCKPHQRNTNIAEDHCR